jgi:hypothetical protein
MIIPNWVGFGVSRTASPSRAASTLAIPKSSSLTNSAASPRRVRKMVRGAQRRQGLGDDLHAALGCEHRLDIEQLPEIAAFEELHDHEGRVADLSQIEHFHDVGVADRAGGLRLLPKPGDQVRVLDQLGV